MRAIWKEGTPMPLEERMKLREQIIRDAQRLKERRENGGKRGMGGLRNPGRSQNLNLKTDNLASCQKSEDIK